MSRKLTITLYVDPGAAVRAGKAEVGSVAIILQERQLRLLTDEQRETLAKHVESQRSRTSGIPSWGDDLTEHAEPIATADLDTLARLLDCRRQVMEAFERSPEGFRQQPVVVPRDQFDALRDLAAEIADGPMLEDIRIWGEAIVKMLDTLDPVQA